MDTVEALGETFDHARRVIGAVGADELGAATPCPRYDVRAVVNHLVGVLEAFTAGLRGEGMDVAAMAGDHLGDDPAGAFDAASRANLAAWQAPGALERTLDLPFGPTPGATAINLNLTDSLVHTWDVATATGQDTTLPEAPAELAFAFVTGMLQPSMRQEGPDAAFGPEVEVAADAPLTDRLVAFLGRRPATAATA